MRRRGKRRMVRRQEFARLLLIFGSVFLLFVMLVGLVLEYQVLRSFRALALSSQDSAGGAGSQAPASSVGEVHDEGRGTVSLTIVGSGSG